MNLPTLTTMKKKRNQSAFLVFLVLEIAAIFCRCRSSAVGSSSSSLEDGEPPDDTCDDFSSDSVLQIYPLLDDNGELFLASSVVVVIDNFFPDSFLRNDIYGNHLTSIADWIPQSWAHRDHYQQQQQRQQSSTQLDTERWLYRPPFPEKTGGFPGVVSTINQQYQQVFLEQLKRHGNNLTSAFIHLQQEQQGDDLQLSRFSFFGNVCYHPDALLPIQSVPHVDRGENARTTEQQDTLALAAIHYVSPHYQGKGGTALYHEFVTNTSRFNTADCRALLRQAAQTYRPGSHDFFCARRMPLLAPVAATGAPQYHPRTWCWWRLHEQSQFEYEYIIVISLLLLQTLAACGVSLESIGSI